jgi:hypothetical protein
MSGSDMPPLKQVARSQPRAAVPRLFPLGLVISPIRARKFLFECFPCGIWRRQNTTFKVVSLDIDRASKA